jgi:predicted transcriptional regulator
MIDRQRDEVIRDILSTASQHSEGVGITKIMFHAYLTHSRAKAYLDDLVQKGLLSNSTSALGRNFYHTTPKGIECLAALSDLTEMLRIESMRRAKSAF